MSEAHIQATIRDFLAISRQNQHNNLFKGFAEGGDMFAAGLPSFPLHQIRAICKAQEQAVHSSLHRFLKK
jgi:hypothetical protein